MIGTRTHSVTLSDQRLVQAVNRWRPVHADAPTDSELIRLLNNLEANGVENASILSLTWLRNEIVRLRKSGCGCRPGSVARENQRRDEAGEALLV